MFTLCAQGGAPLGSVVVSLINPDDPGAIPRNVLQEALGCFQPHAERCSPAATMLRQSCNVQPITQLSRSRRCFDLLQPEKTPRAPGRTRGLDWRGWAHNRDCAAKLSKALTTSARLSERRACSGASQRRGGVRSTAGSRPLATSPRINLAACLAAANATPLHDPDGADANCSDEATKAVRRRGLLLAIGVGARPFARAGLDEVSALPLACKAWCVDA
jgi:hypothetical protein